MADELEARGHEITVAGTVAAALERIKEDEFDVAVTDLMLPDGSGLDVLRSLRELDAPTQCIMLTGYATMATALEAMKLGAYDYLTKPTRLDEIEILIGKAAEKARLLWENAALRVRLQPREAVPGLVGEDPALKKLLQDLDKVAASPLPVLIQGESGTGKELVARAVHARSPRASGPFVPVNCAAIPETLLESELFGHEKGAFTGALARRPGLFEAADHGVLFLDEIGEVALSRAGEAAARDRDARGRPRGQHAPGPGGHPRGHRDQQGPADGERRGPLPRGPLLSPERRHAHAAAAARPPWRHPSAGRALPGQGAGPQAASAGERPRSSRRTPGPATCASCRWWCSARRS